MGSAPPLSAGYSCARHRDSRCRRRSLAWFRGWNGCRDLFSYKHHHGRKRETGGTGGPVRSVDRNRAGPLDDRVAPGTWLLATLAFAGAVPRTGYADQGSDSPNLLLRSNSAGSRTRSRYAIAASPRPLHFVGGDP